MATAEKLSKTQARNRKRREEAKKSKKGNATASAENNDLTNTANTTTNEQYTMQLGFEEEIAWAIDQLHLGIISNRDKKAEVERSQKIIRILQSNQAPETKKKILLRQTFGDYKNKAKQSLLDQAAADAKTSQSQIRSVSSKEQCGRVFRKSYSLQNSGKNTKNMAENSSHDEPFKFNFVENNS